MSDNVPPPPGDVPPPPPGGYGAPPPPPSWQPPPTQPGYGAAPTPGGYGAPVPGVPRPGELLDRFLARLIDGVILGIAGGILSAIFSAILISNQHYDFNQNKIVGGSTILYYIVLGIVLGLLYIGYQAFMESNGGQSVGKMIMKLKVVGADGVSNPTLEQAIRRNIFMAAPLAFIVPVVGTLLGGLAALVGEIMVAVGINQDTVKRQGWHDKFAGGTQVLKIG